MKKLIFLLPFFAITMAFFFTSCDPGTKEDAVITSIRSDPNYPHDTRVTTKTTDGKLDTFYRNFGWVQDHCLMTGDSVTVKRYKAGIPCFIPKE